MGTWSGLDIKTRSVGGSVNDMAPPYTAQLQDQDDIEPRASFAKWPTSLRL